MCRFLSLNKKNKLRLALLGYLSIVSFFKSSFPLFEHFKAAIEFQINADFESQFVVSNAIVEWEQISIARNTLLKSIDFKELAKEFVDPRILFDELPFLSENDSVDYFPGALPSAPSF